MKNKLRSLGIIAGWACIIFNTPSLLLSMSPFNFYNAVIASLGIFTGVVTLYISDKNGI